MTGSGAGSEAVEQLAVDSAITMVTMVAVTVRPVP